MNNHISKYIYTIILILFFKPVLSQDENSFIYEILYNQEHYPDSTNREILNRDMMILLLSSNGESIFASEKYLKMDSVAEVNIKNGGKGLPMNFPKEDFTKNDMVILKKQNYIQTVDMLINFIFDKYSYKENKLGNEWEILPDTINILGITCQKAEVVFGGRKWIAWFSPDYPISDGPYKFCGLPGLILKIYDNQNNWTFSAVSFRSVNKKLKLSFLGKKLSPISKEDFFSNKRKYLGQRTNYLLSKGWVITNKENAINEDLEQAKKDNNWIELYP